MLFNSHYFGGRFGGHNVSNLVKINKNNKIEITDFETKRPFLNQRDRGHFRGQSLFPLQNPQDYTNKNGWFFTRKANLSQ